MGYLARFSLAIVAGLILHPGFACAAEPGLAGRWATFDTDGRRRAIVEIVDRGEKATGRIVELFLNPGEGSDPVCADCAGDARGRSIRGLEILELNRENGSARWHGTVLDPEEGGLYRCTAHLSPDGRTLFLRGFIGIEALGRTDSWMRVDPQGGISRPSTASPW